MNATEIIDKLKIETNNLSDITYRKKIINKETIYIIYNEPITDSDKISDFIIRSLTSIEYNNKKDILDNIENNISNFKIKKIKDYKEIVKYLHKGFTIILVDNKEYSFALETKCNLARSITDPNTEQTVRGAKDAFNEVYQTNIGLIKKRIKTNDLWIENIEVGKYTKTEIGILYINGIVKKEIVNKIIDKINNIDIDGIISSDNIKNLIEKENKSVFPTIETTERPDLASSSLLKGKIVIVVDNSPYVLILPSVFNDFFKTSEDYYSNSINASLTRTLRYIAFFIAMLAPAIYISLINYNQEMIPIDLLINFAIQRNSVPFPAFFEALLMILSFDILRESDIRVPGITGSALSIVGALVLGEAAVNAGIVSPIMIIVIAITAISSLPFTEPEIINGLRYYRLLFMIGAVLMGIIGVVGIFILFIIRLTSLESFGIPYFYPFSPLNKAGLKDSIIIFPEKLRNKRQSFLSKNIIKERSK